MFFTYIIQSKKDGSFYVGYSENPEKRLEKHNNAKTGYTSRKQPWQLVYTKEFKTKTEALKREKFIKNQKNRGFIMSLVNG
ncbi:MAG: GIY-YIG nuclease family protein [Cytophagia bacterium]|nr:GIY-YIG nuclease family protein [Cytophagia bacterium]